MLPFIDPPSGIGVVLSLALDHAPLTRMTPEGTLTGGVFAFEKSPPSGGAGLVVCAKSVDARTTGRNKRRCMGPFPAGVLSGPTACAAGRDLSGLGNPHFSREQRARNGALMTSNVGYSERRKFSRSCCWLELRAPKLPSTVDASLPLLSWSSMAVRRFFVRPS